MMSHVPYGNNFLLKKIIQLEDKANGVPIAASLKTRYPHFDPSG